MSERPREILAFGDSLTWGSCPETGGRHAFEDRWTTRLEAGLGNARVWAEGLRGRTTAFDRPTASADMNGARALPGLLHSHAPLDAVVVMLGSNDLWEGLPEWQTRDGLKRIVEVIRHHPFRLPAPHCPPILLVAPPHLVESPAGDYLSAEKIAASHRIADVVRRVAEGQGVAWADASRMAKASAHDGVHLDAANTRSLGEALVPAVRRLMQD